MAQFEGTIKEFTKFIGGYSRNKVQYITRNYRKEHPQCEGEGCISRTTQLEAAHLRGKERPIIISDILMNFIDNEIVKIDLQEFEDLFIEAHNPIKNAIKMLCKECHIKYDQNNKIKDQGLANVDDTIDIEVLEKQEADLIEELMHKSIMNKGIAMDLACKSSGLKIDSKNSVYSNVNSTKDVWWLEPSPDKFKIDFYMLLNKPKENKLLIFKIPKGTIENPEKTFNQRNDKNASRIVISILDNVDTRGFNFTPYLLKEQVY